MKSNKSSSVEHLQEVARFNTFKARLLTKPFAQHLKKPLAHWAVASDKRLPLALMGLTLGEILNTPFESIAETPGVGQKKISSLVRLLGRAVATDPAEVSSDADILHGYTHQANGHQDGYHDGDPRSGGRQGDGHMGETPSQSAEFCSSSVSEIMWEQWRASVVKHDLGSEQLGRFTPKLRDVTKVIWTSKLGDYTGVTLDEMRKMKTHGEKRVRAILESFHAVHVIVAGAGSSNQTDSGREGASHLVLRVMPRRIDKVERWILQTLQAPAMPDDKAIFENFTRPLLEQIHDDANEQITSLAYDRLGIVRQESAGLAIGRPMTSVRQISKDMGLTRARVYQLLNEINEVMSVRWPSGRYLVNELRNRLSIDAQKLVPPRDLGQFRVAAELFYPGERRGAVTTGRPASSGEFDDEDDSRDGGLKENASSEKFRSRAAEINQPGKPPGLSM